MSLYKLLFSYKGLVDKVTFRLYVILSTFLYIFLFIFFIPNINLKLDIFSLSILNVVIFFIKHIITYYVHFCIFSKRCRDLDLNILISCIYIFYPLAYFASQLIASYADGITYFYIFSILHIFAFIHLGFFGKGKTDYEDLTSYIINNIKISKNIEEFNQSKTDLFNDAYVIFLTKKYNIEFNDALKKYIVVDRLFKTIEESLEYADKLYKNKIISTNKIFKD